MRAVAILMSAALAFPQQEPSFTVDVDLVNVFCSVRDRKGALVNHLNQADFILLEDGVPQTVRRFARETGLPLTVGLLVDTSNSQVRLVDGERQAAAQFFSQVIHATDTAFLISFDAATQVLMEPSGSASSIRAGLDQLRQNSPRLRGQGGTGRPRGTLLYDAVYRAATGPLRKEQGRKAIVLITDGMDVGSAMRIDDAIDAAQKADAIIYSIYYTDSKAFVGDGQFVLQEMSEQTGGRFFRVDRHSPLKKIFDQIQEEMRSQYSLEFVSSSARKDGRYRSLEVLLREPDLQAQARKGYYSVK
jgi:VWFA-related protein